MQSASWHSLLRLIPRHQQENLSLMTSNGTEVCVQSVVRCEPEYLVIRGRLLGTLEDSGFFIVPFDQIVYLTLQRGMKEAEVRGLFGEEPVVDTNGSSAAEPAARGETSVGVAPAGVDKASLLERLRARRSMG